MALAALAMTWPPLPRPKKWRLGQSAPHLQGHSVSLSWRWHRTVHTAPVNCRPLSDVMRAGVAKLATQPPMTAFALAWAEVETIGMASIHLLRR